MIQRCNMDSCNVAIEQTLQDDKDETRNSLLLIKKIHLSINKTHDTGS